MTPIELEKSELNFDRLKHDRKNFISHYGKDAEKVMRSVATKQAKNMDKNKIKEMVKAALTVPKQEEINSEAYLSSRKPMKEVSNPTDTIKMDVPLFIRMLEYAREDAKTDMDLHDTAEKAITLSASGKVLTMADYSSIVSDMKPLNEDWGSSDQAIMNRSIHKELGEPKDMPMPFDSKFESAVEDAVDFYWDEWEEYGSDRKGLIDNAKRRYYMSYFPEKFEGFQKMFSENKTTNVKESGFKSGREFINIKLKKYPKAVAKINQLIGMIGEDKFTMDMAEWIWDFFNNASFESPVNEIVGAKLSEKKLTAAEKRKKEEIVKGMKKSFKGDEGAMYAIATSKAKKLAEDEISEAYVPDNIKSFAKRKGISSLVNKVAGWTEKVGARITGGTAIGKDYSTLILDMGYQTADIYINTDDETIELYGEEVNSFPEFKKVYDDHHKEDLDENAKGWDSSKDTPEIKALMAIADDASNSYAERDEARQKAYDLRAAMSKQDEGLSKGYWAKEIPGGKMEESFKQLVGKLKKQGKSGKAATSIAGAVASYKAKGGGKGPTAKQKARMAETILSKLKGE